MLSIGRARLPGALLLLAAACGHSEPFSTAPPDPLGPPSAAEFRRLTYNLGDDRMPTVSGGSVAYSRLTPDAEWIAPCIAILPPDGGTLRAEYCPPAPSLMDTLVSGWLEPSLSPDGDRLAFVWRRSPTVSALAAWSYHLVVADTATPHLPTTAYQLTQILPGSRPVNTAAELAWISPDVVRFVAAYDSIFKVKGGGTGRFTDTISIRRTLMDLHVSTGAVSLVPGGDSVGAWAPAADGGVWITPVASPDTLFRLAPDGARTSVGVWPAAATDLTVTGDVVVAAVGRDSLYWLAPGPGLSGAIGLPGVAWRLAPHGDHRVVVEVERRDGDQFGAPANLWLIPVPQPIVR